MALAKVRPTAMFLERRFRTAEDTSVPAE